MNPLEYAVIWHVYPLGALGAPIRDFTEDEHAVEHRLPRLIQWLDYVIELGCDTILLNPIFTSVSHGYDTLNHYEIDPRLGDEEDFNRLVRACEERGLKIIVDGVFNHVAATHELVTADGPIKRDDDGNPLGWEGHFDLVELDHSDPRVVEFVVEVMEYWLARGIIGWRLDVAYAVPVEFWAQVISRVRHTYPEAVFIGEIIHGDYLELITEGQLDAVTQYELWKAIWSSLKDENFYELEHALGRHNSMVAGGLMQTFIGNHDVDRIASVVGQAKAIMAAICEFSLPGVPSIYYGDEQGLEGVKGEGITADDPVRPELAPSPWGEESPGSSVHQVYQQLIGMRRRHPWLLRAQVEVEEVSNSEISYRVFRGEQQLRVHLNIREGIAELVFNDEERHHFVCSD